MKRFLAAAIAVIMITAVFAGTVNATDPVRVNSYDEDEAYNIVTSPDVNVIFDHMAWCDNDSSTNHPSSRGVIFNAAVGFVGFGIPAQWNSDGVNAPKVTYDFELFNFTTDYETSVKGTPVYKETLTPEGDMVSRGINTEYGVYFDFGKTMPKGKYVARFNVTSTTGYSVFPKFSSVYSDDTIIFEPGGVPFGFYLMFAETSNTYFLSNSGEAVFVGRSISPDPGTVGVWVDKDHTESAYVKFTAAGAFNAISVGQYWASNASLPNGPEADWTIEIFKFDKNIERTIEGTPVHTEYMHSTGDGKPACNFKFDLVEAGTYVVVFTVTNPDDEMEVGGEIKNPYIVLPLIQDYDEDKFDYDGGYPFNMTVFGEIVDGDFFLDNPDEDYSPDVTSSEESTSEPESSEEVSESTSEESEKTQEDSEETAAESESESEKDPESSKEDTADDTKDDPSDTDAPVTVTPKDVNGDGEANNKDVVDLFRFVSKGESEYDATYDIDNSGEVNNKDVVALFRALSEA